MADVSLFGLTPDQVYAVCGAYDVMRVLDGARNVLPAEGVVTGELDLMVAVSAVDLACDLTRFLGEPLTPHPRSIGRAWVPREEVEKARDHLLAMVDRHNEAMAFRKAEADLAAHGYVSEEDGK